MSLYADEERISEGLLVSQLEFVLLQCEVIEQYSNDPRGESCLVLGYTNDNVPVHIVCGKKSMKNLFIITVYKPIMPKWVDPKNRNR